MSSTLITCLSMRRLYVRAPPCGGTLRFSPTMAEQTDDKYFQQLLNEKPTLDELMEHVRAIKKWYKFGVLLLLPASELDAIENLNRDRDIEFKSLKMFELWLSTNPNATRREVIETLCKDAIGKSAVAEEYTKTLKESE